MEAKQRATIITEARKMVVKFGVKSLRMDDLAQATHTSKRTLYETFGDKEELLFLAVQEHFKKFDESNLEATKGAGNILIAMLIVMEEIRKNAEVNWQIRSTLRKFYPRINERLWSDKADVKRRIIAESLKEGIKDGYIDSRINVDLTMNMFNYIAIGITEHNDQIEIPSSINIEDAFQEVLVNYIRGISTTKGIEAVDKFLSERAEK